MKKCSLIDAILIVKYKRDFSFNNNITNYFNDRLE